jgi:hypothetical protein
LRQELFLAGKQRKTEKYSKKARIGSTGTNDVHTIASKQLALRPMVYRRAADRMNSPEGKRRYGDDYGI